MNIEIANRLVNLRKANGLSQEALAEKLGISRQAVSKWERAEASQAKTIPPQPAKLLNQTPLNQQTKKIIRLRKPGFPSP